ncbi:MAG TPA: M81 family metallopeptidase [Acidobacteriota bacterium]|nr:M81 family metallopeptidase [Acidobacteriota bacterium]
MFAGLFTFLLLASGFSQSARKPRIAIGGISHESNSFNPDPTALSEFSQETPEATPEWFERAGRDKSVRSGVIEGARRFGLELHPTFFADASPKGPVTAEAFETLTGKLLERLSQASNLDGLILINHGAMVSEEHLHGDAEIVRRIREAFGPDFPIVVTHDFHANVSEEIIRDSDVLITYKENPHLDTYERGLQAAEVMAGIVAGRVKPVQVVAKPPMLYNIVHQNTFNGPLTPIVKESRRLEENPKILAVSVSGGYQYADSPAMGPSVVVATDGDPELARREAHRLADMVYATRDRLGLDLPKPAEAVKLAMESEEFPILLMEMADNIGGGSSGDATFILEELIRQRAQGWVMAMYDRAATEEAFRLGVGGSFDMEVGGKTDDLHGSPVRVRGRIKSLHDGNYVETEVRHGGRRYQSMGQCAVLEVEGSTPDLPNLILLTGQKTSPNSLHQIISVGIYPERQRILVAKGAIAPRAAYEPIVHKIINVDSPGTTAVNPAYFTYKNARRPLFGLESPEN